MPMSRIDDAVTRILRVKFAMGLMEPTIAAQRPTASLHRRASARAEHRAVARQAVRESLVLLKNERNALPLVEDGEAHPRRRQERRRHRQPVRRLDDRLAGQERRGHDRRHDDARRRSSSRVEVRRKSPTPRTAPAPRAPTSAVVVIGETPYAEMMGDRARSFAVRTKTCQASRTRRRPGIPVVVVLVLGPAADHQRRAGASRRASSPHGCRAPKARASPTCSSATTSRRGKLPVSWPKSASQIPINVGDASYDPLFPYGFGLSY